MWNHYLMSATVIVIILCLSNQIQATVSGNQFITVTNDNPVVKEELGLVLSPDKILASSSETIVQSVFMKIGLPKEPAVPCLTCSPVLAELREIVQPLDGCWIPRMVVPRSSLLNKLGSTSIVQCLNECLQHSLCELISYDASSETCYLQTNSYYRVDATSPNVKSSSALLSCLLDNHDTNRASLCKQENPVFSTVLASIKDHHNFRLSRYVQKFADLSLAYGLQIDSLGLSNETTRGKRFISWNNFDFIEEIPVLGWFYQIVKQPHENKKLKNHILSLQENFVDFTRDVAARLEQTRQFQSQVLQLIDVELQTIHSALSGLKCDINSLVSLILYQQNIEKSHLKIAALFYQVRHGNLLADTAQTLSLNDLKMIVQQNRNFQDTIDQTNPEIVFRVGELALVQAAHFAGEVTFHFILIVPKITRETLYQTYKATKVPITENSTSPCYLVHTPQVIFKKDGKFYATDTSECSNQREVILCQQDFGDRFSPNLIEDRCLNDEPEHCIFEAATCAHRMAFTRGGALVFSREAVLAMERGDTTKTKLTVVSTQDRNTYFLPWELYLYAQTGINVIYALDNSIVVRNISYPAPQYLEKLKFQLYNTTLKYENENITLLKKLIEETADIALEDYRIELIGTSKKRLLEIITYISWTLTFATTIYFLIKYCCKRAKQKNQILQAAIAFVAAEKRERKTLSSHSQNQILQHLDLLNPPKPKRSQQPPKILEEHLLLETSTPQEDTAKKQPETKALLSQQNPKPSNTVIDAYQSD